MEVKIDEKNLEKLSGKLDFSEVKRQGKWLSIYGLVMSATVVNLVVFVWNLFLLAVQGVGLCLIVILDFITWDTIHFTGGPAGIDYRAKIIKKKGGWGGRK